eukprot:scaffold3664_cov407-Prasinococcus_capsulatus_cf.AAC.3
MSVLSVAILVPLFYIEGYGFYSVLKIVNGTEKEDVRLLTYGNILYNEGNIGWAVFGLQVVFLYVFCNMVKPAHRPSITLLLIQQQRLRAVHSSAHASPARPRSVSSGQGCSSSRWRLMHDCTLVAGAWRGEGVFPAAAGADQRARGRPALRGAGERCAGSHDRGSNCSGYQQCAPFFRRPA